MDACFLNSTTKNGSHSWDLVEKVYFSALGNRLDAGLVPLGPIGTAAALAAGAATNFAQNSIGRPCVTGSQILVDLFVGVISVLGGAKLGEWIEVLVSPSSYLYKAAPTVGTSTRYDHVGLNEVFENQLRFEATNFIPGTLFGMQTNVLNSSLDDLLGGCTCK